MKTLTTLLVTVGLLGGGTARALAHDDGWSTAGKVLTGLAAAHVIAHTISHGPACHPPVVYTAPPVPVRPPVYVAPAPVVVHRPARPVFCAPPPVRVYCPPVVRIQVGIGHRHGHHKALRYHPPGRPRHR